MKIFNSICILLLIIASALAAIAWPTILGITLIESWQKVINSIFAITAFSTLVAAFAGAFGAQYIVERNKNREFLLREIRNVNAAIVIAFGICNGYLSLKKQHVKAMKEKYDRERADVIAKTKSGTPQTVAIIVDLQVIQPPTAPTDILSSYAFEKLSAEGRILSLAATINQAADSLNDSIEKRNDLISQFRKIPLNDPQFPILYYGLPFGGGHVDAVYPSTMEAIANQLDDCIHFSKIICFELHDYGQYVRKKFGDNAPTISKPDFAKAEKAGLMPDPKIYESWEKAFEKKYIS